MAYKLVIVESPTKARTIGKFLGRGYKVEASQGHVRDLPKSQLGVDPENNFEPKYITIRGRGEILAKIRKEAKGASKIYLATDPDREGEAISWHLAHILDIADSDVCRIEFHEITSAAVKKAVKNPRTIDLDLVNAQQARRVLDRLVGYQISPLLWRKVKKGLSAGRVQSVATAMICDREEEIETFEPEEYWTLSLEFTGEAGTFTARYMPADTDKGTLASKEECEAVTAKLASADFSVASVKKSERKRYPAAPFTTSNLQQEASRKLNFTTVKTMQIAQQLYEGIDLEGGTQGVITYIRTDSVRTAEEANIAAREMISGKYGAAYVPETPNVYKSRRSAQDAHEAIRPTDMTRTPESVKAVMTRDQYKLYKLIYERFISSQMTPAVYDTVSADITGNGEVFRYSGQKLRFPGFTAVYVEGSDDTEEEQPGAFAELTDGMSLRPGEPQAEQHFTQAPPRYTEASLVRALEEKGIGRPSTYAPTIATIVARGYITREKKRLIPTELGSVVNELMQENFKDIVDIAFTADMEEKLDEVEEGKVDWHNVISDFYGPFEETLKKAESSIEKVEVEDVVSDVKCERCGAMMVYKMGRYGKFLACPNFPACTNTMTIQKNIGVACPECGAAILERTSKKGRRFYGCERYPDCGFVSWDMPVAEKCPKCGGYMVLKRGRKGEMYHVCADQNCRTRVAVTPEVGSDE